MRGFTFIIVFALFAAACGTEPAGEGSGSQQAAPAPEATTVGKPAADRLPSAEAAELAKAELGRQEITTMLPADGKKPDPARLLPEDPPRGIKVYPATANTTTEEPIEYARRPPTNGKHDPLWQNCGSYEKPIKDRHAVHSLDHGVVWITHQPDLPQPQVRKLREYAAEPYVIVSPYPGQSAPATATAWRVQLELQSADDPRLRRFVDQFRVSELAPLSGNRCEFGVGNPRG